MGVCSGTARPSMEERESEQDSYALQCFAFCNLVNLEQVFQNIWFFYLIFILLLIFLPAFVYAVFIKCCHPDRFSAVKWHVIIFIVNSSLWYVLTVTILAGVCGLPISHGFYIIALPFLAILVILTVLDMFLSPEGKYFLSSQRVYTTSEYLEMVSAALPSIKVNVKSLYREPIQKNLKLNRPARKMIVSAHRYFPIDSFSDEQFVTFKTKFISSCQRNRGGQFLEDTVEMDIPGLEERVVTVNNLEGVLPWWARRKMFYVLSALSASIILRILFQTRSRRHNMVATKKYFLYPLDKGGGDEADPGRCHGGYEEYQPFLAEEDGPPPYNPTIEWK